MTRRGVLLDRDGTLIRDVGYLCRVDQMELLPHAAESVRLLREAGLTIAIVTNQSAVGRGLLDETQLASIHRELEARLAAGGAKVDGIYYCPHHPTEAIGTYRIRCDCRKPQIGMARRAAEDLDLDLSRSYVIGDKESDMKLAEQIGARGILLDGEPSADTGYFPARDLRQAALLVVDDMKRAERRKA
ncbi:MAG TPA: HAD family hydrolase [Candidatus Binatia bacterium]|nr:HAD family hydrolase [Candidatus Binatia bacterium]